MSLYASGMDHCEMLLKDPQFVGETLVGETFTNGGGAIGHGFLYIPSKDCAVHVTVNNCIEYQNKISSSELFKKLSEFNIDSSSGKQVKVEARLANAIALESKEGSFEDSAEIKCRYNNLPNLFQLAMLKVAELYFVVSCNK